MARISHPSFVRFIQNASQNINVMLGIASKRINEKILFRKKPKKIKHMCYEFITRTLNYNNVWLCMWVFGCINFELSLFIWWPNVVVVAAAGGAFYFLFIYLHTQFECVQCVCVNTINIRLFEQRAILSSHTYTHSNCKRQVLSPDSLSTETERQHSHTLCYYCPWVPTIACVYGAETTQKKPKHPKYKFIHGRQIYASMCLNTWQAAPHYSTHQQQQQPPSYQKPKQFESYNIYTQYLQFLNKLAQTQHGGWDTII